MECLNTLSDFRKVIELLQDPAKAWTKIDLVPGEMNGFRICSWGG